MMKGGIIGSAAELQGWPERISRSSKLHPRLSYHGLSGPVRQKLHANETGGWERHSDKAALPCAADAQHCVISWALQKHM